MGHPKVVDLVTQQCKCSNRVLYRQKAKVQKWNYGNAAFLVNNAESWGREFCSKCLQMERLWLVRISEFTKKTMLNECLMNQLKFFDTLLYQSLNYRNYFFQTKSTVSNKTSFKQDNDMAMIHHILLNFSLLWYSVITCLEQTQNKWNGHSRMHL